MELLFLYFSYNNSPAGITDDIPVSKRKQNAPLLVYTV